MADGTEGRPPRLLGPDRGRRAGDGEDECGRGQELWDMRGAVVAWVAVLDEVEGLVPGEGSGASHAAGISGREQGEAGRGRHPLR